MNIEIKEQNGSYLAMKEGFLIGGGLIFAGLMLQLSVGPVLWDAHHLVRPSANVLVGY